MTAADRFDRTDRTDMRVIIFKSQGCSCAGNNAKVGQIGAVTNPLIVNHQSFLSFGCLDFSRGANGKLSI